MPVVCVLSAWYSSFMSLPPNDVEEDLMLLLIIPDVCRIMYCYYDFHIFVLISDVISKLVSVDENILKAPVHHESEPLKLSEDL